MPRIALYAKQAQAERDENTCRKDFAPSEAVNVGKTIEALEKMPAQERQRSQGARGKEGGRGRKKNPLDDLSKGYSQAESNRTTTKAAKTVGMSRIPYERAKAVVEAAEEDPFVRRIIRQSAATSCLRVVRVEELLAVRRASHHHQHLRGGAGRRVGWNRDRARPGDQADAAAGAIVARGIPHADGRLYVTAPAEPAVPARPLVSAVPAMRARLRDGRADHDNSLDAGVEWPRCTAVSLRRQLAQHGAASMWRGRPFRCGIKTALSYQLQVIQGIALRGRRRLDRADRGFGH